MANLRTRSTIAIALVIIVVLFTLRHNLPDSAYTAYQRLPSLPSIPNFGPTPAASPENEHIIPDHPIYKPEPSSPPFIIDNFPLAAEAHSVEDLPPIPPWNRPPSPHVAEKTPLFIGFTRNWNLLQQTVVAWITAGWPPEDIWVFENTGVMKSNELGLLSIQNPFFLNHTRLHMLGVNVLICPTILSFAQLQNYFLWTAIQNDMPTYFWGHMDTLAISSEDSYAISHPEPHVSTTDDRYEGYESIYMGAVRSLRQAVSPDPDPNASDPSKPWAARFFAYDRLALVNRSAFESIGGWDAAIPYYHTDCDMHDRLKMYGFEYNLEDVQIGMVHDVASTLDDLLPLYRKKNTPQAAFTVEKSAEERGTSMRPRSYISADWFGKPKEGWVSDTIGSSQYQHLMKVAGELADFKAAKGGGGRNFWQNRQSGGMGEPYYRDAVGFETGLQMMIELGRAVYAEKWGHKDCGLLEFGRKAGDEWRVEHDWAD